MFAAAVSFMRCRPVVVAFFLIASCERPRPEVSPVSTVATAPREPATRWRLGEVLPFTEQAEGCALEVGPAPEFVAVRDWLGAFLALDPSGTASEIPADDAAARSRLCEGGNSSCGRAVTPLVLAIGSEALPGAYRVGFLVRRSTGLEVYGPWDAGVQIMHCVPIVATVDVDPAPWLEHAGLTVVHKRAVLMGENGECEEGTPDCVRGCAVERVDRYDLYVEVATGETLLVAQQRLPVDPFSVDVAIVPAVTISEFGPTVRSCHGQEMRLPFASGKPNPSKSL
jgi:hypothetical protein